MMYALPVPIRMCILFIWRGWKTGTERSRLSERLWKYPRRNYRNCRRGEYYYFQLIGLTVVSDTGDTVGTLTEIIETGANNVYAVKTAEGKEIYLPAIQSCVLSVQPEEKTMTVHLPEWE